MRLTFVFIRVDRSGKKQRMRVKMINMKGRYIHDSFRLREIKKK